MSEKPTHSRPSGPVARGDRPYARALELLRGAGLRPTRQRLALARLLFDSGDRHVTAEQLHVEAQSSGVKVALATVYNTLHQFQDAGLLSQVVVDSSRSYFDTNTSEHHHFFLEDEAELRDIELAQVDVGALPELPEGTELERVDVIVRLRAKRA